MHVADRREWKKLFRGTPSLHRHLSRRSSPSSSPDEFHSAASSARACPAQLTQTHCLGGRAAPLREAPRPRSSVLPSGASRSNGLRLDLSPSSVRISWRLTRFLSCISGDTQTRGRSCAPAHPFCSHLYSDSIQMFNSSITNHWPDGRSGQLRAGFAA